MMKLTTKGLTWIFFCQCIGSLRANSKTQGIFPNDDGELSINEQRIRALETSLEEQIRINAQQQDAISQLQEAFNRQQEQCISTQNPRDSPEIFANSAFGCIMDELTLSCPSERWINVTNALYGQYADTCDGCCTPHQDDCSELTVENNPAQWLNLKLTCDNETSCSYTYSGEVINDCEVAYVADYMHIFYDCLPEAENDPVGFTAYTTVTHTYSINDTVLFDEVLTNLGGHYQHPESTFICPYTGIYMFNVGFNSAEYMVVSICLDSEELVSVWADELVGYHRASGFVITQCSAGQMVWLKAAHAGSVYGEARLTQFSGYMLYRV